MGEDLLGGRPGATPGRRGPQVAVAVALLLLAGAAFLARTTHYGVLSREGAFLISEPDSLYHLRLARLIAHDWPRVPGFDPYLNYPGGSEIYWPFLQDFVTATLAKLAPGGGVAALERICFFYPAVAGSLALLVVFLLSRGLGLGRAPSLLAAGLASLVPAQIGYTAGGSYDHHAGDLLLGLLVILCSQQAWRLRARPPRDRGALAAFAGLAAASVLALLNWLGAAIYFIVLLGAATLATGFRSCRRDPSWPSFLARAGMALGAAAVLLAAILALAYGPAKLAAVASEKPSAFHPLLLAGSGLYLGALAQLLRGGQASLRTPRLWATLLALAAAAAAAVGPLWHGYSYYLVAGNRALLTIAEFRSILVDPHSDFLNPRLSAARVGATVTWGLLLAPLFCAGIWRRGLDGRRERSFPEALFLAFFAVQGLMALRQYRYALVLSAPLAIGAAWTAAQAGEAVRDRARRPWVRALAGALCVAALAAFAPGVQHLKKKMADPHYRVANYGYMRSLDALSRTTPPPSDFLDPAQTPAYGVMCGWDIGHNVIEAGERPAVATGFLDSLRGEYFLESMRFFVEEDPEAARLIMERNRLRYLVLHNAPNSVVQAYFTLGDDGAYRALARQGAKALARSGRFPVALRLWERHGAAVEAGGRLLGGTRHFRLLREDFFVYPGDGSMDRIQIYELVPGAVLEGLAPPGSLVSARIGVVGNLGGRFSYEEAARADAGGRFALVVPYASEGPGGAVRTEGPYLVRAQGRAAAEVRVTEEDVRGGARLRVF